MNTKAQPTAYYETLFKEHFEDSVSKAKLSYTRQLYVIDKAIMNSPDKYYIRYQ